MMALRDCAPTILEAVRETSPLIQCLTNSVVTSLTANVLLAAGATPAMVDITGEAGPFAALASGLLINLGTPHPEQREAALEAADGAVSARTPWVLDPVAIGALTHRTALAHRLVELGPTVVRGNASEIIALLGGGGGGRGPETADDVEAALDAARTIATRHGAVVAVSGPVDAIVSAGRTTRVAGGSPMLTRITGGGCALGALIAAFVAAGRSSGHDPHTATAACHAVYSAAAELAAARATGPGSFQPALLDALDAVRARDLDRVTITEEAA